MNTPASSRLSLVALRFGTVRAEPLTVREEQPFAHLSDDDPQLGIPVEDAGDDRVQALERDFPAPATARPTENSARQLVARSVAQDLPGPGES